MLEKTVENHLRRLTEEAGGLCLKWVCPGHKGVPDRMLLFPGGLIAFVELKRPDTKVQQGGLQEWWRDRLHSYGFSCYEVRSQRQAELLVKQLRRQSEELLFADLMESEYAEFGEADDAEPLP